MAIDTRQKRRSAIGMMLPFRSVAPPIPDNSFSQADRQQMLLGYAGILWAVLPSYFVYQNSRWEFYVDDAETMRLLPTGDIVCPTGTLSAKIIPERISQSGA